MRNAKFKHSEETKRKLSQYFKGRKTGFNKEKHWSWKGDDISKPGLHCRVYRELGKATYCSFDKTHKAKRYEWANISHEYKPDIADFMPLCSPCHKKYDATQEHKEALLRANWGNKHAAKPVRQYSKDGKFLKQFMAVIDAERELGISNTTIHNCLRGRAKSAGGFVWRRD